MITRYSKVLAHIHSLFSSSAWNAENFVIYPIEYAGIISVTTYGKFNIVINQEAFQDNLKGILYIDIYSPVTLGHKAAVTVADLLDKHLSGKSFKINGEDHVTQFRRESNFEMIGAVPNNNSLIKSTYQIQFSFYTRKP